AAMGSVRRGSLDEIGGRAEPNASKNEHAARSVQIARARPSWTGDFDLPLGSAEYFGSTTECCVVRRLDRVIGGRRGLLYPRWTTACSRRRGPAHHWIPCTLYCHGACGTAYRRARRVAAFRDTAIFIEDLANQA